MTPYAHNKNAQSGNVFIYIIGAIFLIGILTVTIKGSSTPGSGIDQEELILKATQVRAYAAELERGVSYVLRNAHSETEISFAHPNHSSAYGTYGTTPTAEVFHPSGGGVEWRDNDADIQSSDEDWMFLGENVVDGVGTTELSSGAGELIAFLPYVSEGLCMVLNDQVEVNNPSNAPPPQSGTLAMTLFAGTLDFNGDISDTNLSGKFEGCFEGEAPPAIAGTYHYYKVLVAR